MIKTTSMMLEDLHDYASPKTKLSRMAKGGECIQITRGLYETDGNAPPYVLAGSIYGPSYISFEYALSYYSLIPEAVYAVTSATFAKKKKKRYETPFGVFTYRDVPDRAFPLFVELKNEGDYWYRIASEEKALCDRLYIAPPVKNRTELKELLFEDLRMESRRIFEMDISAVAVLSEAYHCTNVNIFAAYLRR